MMVTGVPVAAWTKVDRMTDTAYHIIQIILLIAVLAVLVLNRRA